MTIVGFYLGDFYFHARRSGRNRHAPRSQDGEKYGGERPAFEEVEEARDGGSI